MSFSSTQKTLLKSIGDKYLFQRLRRIKQLGLAQFIFPSATHCRFQHSIGVAFLAKTVFDSIRSGDEYEHEAAVTFSAGLLHDIGHCAFSHTFEKYLISDTQGEKVEIKHEDWTGSFIREISLEAKVAQGILGNRGWKHIEALIQGKIPDNSWCFYRDIISSQIDCDRMDYLLRDAYFCGVNYSYDVQWMINSLTEIKLQDNHSKLGIKAKGIGALEQYLLARRMMTRYIYHHPKSATIAHILSLTLEKLEVSLHQNTPLVKGCPGYLSDFFHKAKQFREGENDKEKFIDTAYQDYKHISDDDIWQILGQIRINKAKTNNDRALKTLSKILLERQFPKVVIIQPERSCDFLKYYQEIHGIKELEKDISCGKTSESVTTYRNGTGKVLLDQFGENIEFSHSSAILGHIADKTEKHHYFWYLPDKLEAKSSVRDFLKKIHKKQITKHPPI